MMILGTKELINKFYEKHCLTVGSKSCRTNYKNTKWKIFGHLKTLAKQR